MKSDLLILPLGEIKNLLLPGLLKIQSEYGKEFESDIRADFIKDCITALAYRPSTKKRAQVDITRRDLVDGLFREKINKLFEDLKK